MKREHGTDNILPIGYRRLEYIESTGTQYIDTLYKPNDKTYYYIDFQPTKTDIGGNQYGFVRWSGAYTYDTFGISDGASSNYQIYFYYGRFSYNQYQNLGVNTSAYLGQRHTAYIDGLSKISNLDDTYYATIGNYTYQSLYNMVLFAFNNMGNITADGYLKMFECIINDNNIPQRHYLPALRIADSKPGLYDIINNQFYTNAGTGEFLYA